MPIMTKDRFFGEGLSSYGEESASDSFYKHRDYIRAKRLEDLLGSDEAKLTIKEIIARIDKINAAISAADKQATDDNAEFIVLHGINPDAR